MKKKFLQSTAAVALLVMGAGANVTPVYADSIAEQVSVEDDYVNMAFQLTDRNYDVLDLGAEFQVYENLGGGVRGETVPFDQIKKGERYFIVIENIDELVEKNPYYQYDIGLDLGFTVPVAFEGKDMIFSYSLNLREESVLVEHIVLGNENYDSSDLKASYKAVDTDLGEHVLSVDLNADDMYGDFDFTLEGERAYFKLLTDYELEIKEESDDIVLSSEPAKVYAVLNDDNTVSYKVSAGEDLIQELQELDKEISKYRDIETEDYEAIVDEVQKPKVVSRSVMSYVKLERQLEDKDGNVTVDKNAKYELYKLVDGEEVKVDEFTTNEDGIGVSKKLTPGLYELVNVEGDERFELDESFTFTVKKSDDMKAINFTNVQSEMKEVEEPEVEDNDTTPEVEEPEVEDNEETPEVEDNEGEETPEVEAPEAEDNEDEETPEVETPEVEDNDETPEVEEKPGVETPEVEDNEDEETPEVETPEVEDNEDEETPEVEIPSTPEKPEDEDTTPEVEIPEVDTEDDKGLESDDVNLDGIIDDINDIMDKNDKRPTYRPESSGYPVGKGKPGKPVDTSDRQVALGVSTGMLGLVSALEYIRRKRK